MSDPTFSLGVGARDLKDKDFFSKSDPYLTISRPNTSGSYTVLRTSETKKVKKKFLVTHLNCLYVFQNNLNPEWADFLFMESELNRNDKEIGLRLVLTIFG